jgi:hypothetical protein
VLPQHSRGHSRAASRLTWCTMHSSCDFMQMHEMNLLCSRLGVKPMSHGPLLDS